MSEPMNFDNFLENFDPAEFLNIEGINEGVKEAIEEIFESEESFNSNYGDAIDIDYKLEYIIDDKHDQNTPGKFLEKVGFKLEPGILLSDYKWEAEDVIEKINDYIAEKEEAGEIDVPMGGVNMVLSDFDGVYLELGIPEDEIITKLESLGWEV